MHNIYTIPDWVYKSPFPDNQSTHPRSIHKPTLPPPVPALLRTRQTPFSTPRFLYVSNINLVFYQGQTFTIPYTYTCKWCGAVVTYGTCKACDDKKAEEKKKENEKKEEEKKKEEEAAKEQ